MTKQRKCKACKGTGNKTPREVVESWVSYWDGTRMETSILAECPDCKGTGWR